MKLDIYRLRTGAITPRRRDYNEAGMPFHYCPNFNEGRYGVKSDYLDHKVESDGQIILFGGASVLIPTGLKVCVPTGYVLELKDNIDNASKRRLVTADHVIDPNFKDEVYVNVHNLGANSVEVINPGDLLCTAYLLQVAQFDIVKLAKEPKRI